MQSCDLNAELAPVAGLRQRDMTDMKFDVEIRIVDPVGTIEIQRHLFEFLAKGLGTVRSVIDEREDIFQCA